MTATEHPISMAVTFPTSNPDGEAAAHVELGASLDDVPTWSLHTLNAGPARSSPAYGRHLEATIGSSYDWSDELRFDKRTGKLTGFVLKMPEAGALEPAITRSWARPTPTDRDPGARSSRRRPDAQPDRRGDRDRQEAARGVCRPRPGKRLSVVHNFASIGRANPFPDAIATHVADDG
jgi:hypothetical protein